MTNNKGKGTYSKVTATKGYTRYKGTSHEQKVSGSKRRTGYSYDRDELIKMHLARPIIDRAIDERIKANLISERKWVMSNGNAGDLEGIDDRITSTHDLTPEQKIMVLNGILKRLGIKTEIVIAEPIRPSPPTEKLTPRPTSEVKIKKAVPYALLPKKEQEKIKEEVKKETIKKIKEEKPKSVSKSELESMLEGLESF